MLGYTRNWIFFTGPLTYYSREQLYSTYNGGTQNITSPVFVIVGILTGKACGGSQFCSAPQESSYVNLRDPDVHRFLRREVLMLNCQINATTSCTLINRPDQNIPDVHKEILD